MLDTATWLKTVEHINRFEDCQAEVVFTCSDQRLKAPRNVTLLMLGQIRYVYYFFYLLRLFLFLRARLKNSENTTVFFDVFSFPIIPLLRFFGYLKSDNAAVIDYRTFYFNYSCNEGVSFKDRFFKWLTIRSFKYAYRNKMRLSIIVVKMKDFMKDYIDVESMDVIVWSSGVEPEDFKLDQNRISEYREKFSWLNEAPAFIFHGHLTENRGIEQIIESFAKLKGNLDFHFLIIGDGPQKKSVEESIKINDIEDRCHFLGRIDYSEIKYYIALCDIAIMTYPILKYWEYNNPIKLSEYMILNKFIITSKISSFSKMVSNGRGLVIDSVEIKSIKRAIEYACNNIEKIRSEEPENESSDYILENYTWRKQAEIIIGNSRK
ncbi:MAG: glycosyltransferase [Schleiferiaceae bacterium]|nr:glycosyltransferase [Schleiferiaceae bacterium]